MHNHFFMFFPELAKFTKKRAKSELNCLAKKTH